MIEEALDRLLGWITSIAQISAWIAGAILAISALIVGYDITIRYFLNQTIGGAIDIAGYALAVASTWGITLTLLKRSHVRIDSVYTHLPTRVRSFLDIVGLLAFISFMGLVARYAYGVVEQSAISRTKSVSALELPLVYPQAIWFAGLVFFLFSASILLLRSFVAFAKGEMSTVHGLVGARSTVEEIEAEHQIMHGQDHETARKAENDPRGET